jgi:hypothetical protein
MPVDKLDRLLAIEEIKQLKARYFRFLDTKDWAGMATIFTDDAVFDARTANSVSGVGEGDAAASNDWVYEGGSVIVDFIREVTQPLTTAHHGHCHEIEILSETDARGVIAMEDVIWDAPGAGGQKVLHGWGHYHEEYRRGQGGRWQIRRSRLTRLNVILG